MYGPIVYIFFSIYYMRSWSIAGNLSAEWTASSKMDRLVYGKTFPLKRFSFFFCSRCFCLGKLGRRSKHGAHIEPYWLLRGGLSKPMYMWKPLRTSTCSVYYRSSWKRTTAVKDILSRHRKTNGIK